MNLESWTKHRSSLATGVAVLAVVGVIAPTRALATHCGAVAAVSVEEAFSRSDLVFLGQYAGPATTDIRGAPSFHQPHANVYAVVEAFRGTRVGQMLVLRFMEIDQPPIGTRSVIMATRNGTVPGCTPGAFAPEGAKHVGTFVYTRTGARHAYTYDELVTALRETSARWRALHPTPPWHGPTRCERGP